MDYLKLLDVNRLQKAEADALIRWASSLASAYVLRPAKWHVPCAEGDSLSFLPCWRAASAALLGVIA